MDPDDEQNAKRWLALAQRPWNGLRGFSADV